MQDLITQPQKLSSMFIEFMKSWIIQGKIKKQQLASLNVLQESIRSLAIFSPNQSLKEVQDAHLKYLLTPFLLGQYHNNVTQNRKKEIQLAKQYYNAYINILKIYNCQEEVIFPLSMYNYFKAINDESYDKGKLRQLLIENQKNKMVLNKQFTQQTIIFMFQKEDRQSIIKYLSLKLYQSIREIKSIKQQILILNYAYNIKNNDKQAQMHENQMKKPIPKMRFWKFQKTPQINSKQIVKTHEDHLCQPCQQQIKNGIGKLKIKNEVFQMNKNQPTMTLDQVDKLQYDNFMNRQKKYKELAKLNKQDSDSDKQEVDDRKKKQARKWDDWKDQNEKGIGNRGNM